MLAACLFLAGYIAVRAITQHGRPAELISLQAARLPLASIKPRPLSGNPEGIDLNSASREELMALPGISAGLADAIIAQREQRPFSFIQDLGLVKGIGAKRLEMFMAHGYVGEAP